MRLLRFINRQRPKKDEVAEVNDSCIRPRKMRLLRLGPRRLEARWMPPIAVAMVMEATDENRESQ